MNKHGSRTILSEHAAIDDTTSAENALQKKKRQLSREGRKVYNGAQIPGYTGDLAMSHVPKIGGSSMNRF